MENHAKESIKHKIVLPNSKTINIEGTNFKYEIHYDQLDEKDLLMIEKYANHIFHAYQEKYGLDINTDHTFKGFIYNSLTDLRNARPGHNNSYATANVHYYPHKSESVAHDLTEMIYFTLNFYNKQSRNIPIPKGNFTIDVEKELKAIRLDDNQEESKKIELSGSEEEKIKVDEEKSRQEEISPEKHQTINQEESNTAEKPETTINQEEPKRIEPSGSGGEEKIKLDEEKSRQEEISPETVLPNSKTINIEGTNFKYEIHYDQLNDKDLLTIERYANHIFHAYQARYGLDVSTDYTFKGFTYNNLTDLRHGAYANAYGHHYHYKSESIAHKLTDVIYLTLNLYNMENHGTPYLEDKYTFIRDVEKELKAIRLDDNQEESNTGEKPETTINQEEPKKIEPSGSGEEEKIKLDEEKSGQEKISPETVLPNSKIINIEGTKFKYEIHYDQLDEKDLLTIEKYANYIFHAYQERYGLDMNTDHTVKGFIYNNLTDFRSATNLGDGITVHATSNNHRYPHNSGSVAHHDLTTAIYFTLSLYNKEKYGIPPNENRFIRNVAEELKAIRLDDNQEESNTGEKPETTINQEEPKKIEPSGSGEEEKIKLDEEKSGQEKISPETVLPNSKTINIEGTKFKYEIHYDQLDEKDLLTIEKYANYIFHAYQERYGLDMNTDHTVKGFTYNNLANLSDDDYDSITADYHEYHYHSESIANDLTTMIYVTLNLYNEKNYGTSFPRGEFIRDVAEELKNIGLDDNQGELNTEERPKTTINQEKQEKELKESDQQDVITTTDHPLDDYNHDYHLIG